MNPSAKLDESGNLIPPPGGVAIIDTASGKVINSFSTGSRVDLRWLRDGSLLVHDSDTLSVRDRNGALSSSRPLAQSASLVALWSPGVALVIPTVSDAQAAHAGPLSLLSLAGGDPQTFWLSGLLKAGLTIAGPDFIGPDGLRAVFFSEAGLETASLDGSDRRVLAPGNVSGTVYW